MRRRRRSSRAFLLSPAFTIRYPTPAAERTSVSVGLIMFPGAPPRVRMRLEVQLPTAPIGYVRIQLGRGEIGVTEHLLDAAQIGPSFEQVSGEGVPEQVRVNPFGLEPRFRRKPTEDEESAGARQRAALRVEEQLGPVAAVEVRTSAREVPANG